MLEKSIAKGLSVEAMVKLGDGPEVELEIIQLNVAIESLGEDA